MKAGSYVTTGEGEPMSGAVAQQLLALPHEKPPDAYFEVTISNDIPVIGPKPVARTEIPPRTGGGIEYILPEGAPGGTVSGPFPLPPEDK